MTVHLISVGLSVLDALETPERKISDRDETDAIRAAGVTALLDENASGAEADAWMRTDAWDAMRAALATVDVALWEPGISAEIDTFARVDPGEIPLLDGDKAVLICSDTPKGLLSGLWNAAVLAGGNLDKIRYLPSPESGLELIAGGVLIVRAEKLDARFPAQFSDAFRGLGVLARNLFTMGKLSKGEEFRFYLSGGYKAAIPYLIGLAEAVRSVDARRLRQLGVGHLMPGDAEAYPSRAFVLHDTAPQGAKAIELPLRRLVAEAVRNELRVFGKTGTSDRTPEFDQLEGYAYEKEGRGTYRLTPFGAGLRELHGVPAESLL